MARWSPPDIATCTLEPFVTRFRKILRTSLLRHTPKLTCKAASPANAQIRYLKSLPRQSPRRKRRVTKEPNAQRFPFTCDKVLERADTDLFKGSRFHGTRPISYRHLIAIASHQPQKSSIRSATVLQSGATRLSRYAVSTYNSDRRQYQATNPQQNLGTTALAGPCPINAPVRAGPFGYKRLRQGQRSPTLPARTRRALPIARTNCSQCTNATVEPIV